MYCSVRSCVRFCLRICYSELFKVFMEWRCRNVNKFTRQQCLNWIATTDGMLTKYLLVKFCKF